MFKKTALFLNGGIPKQIMIRDPLNGAWCDNLYFPDVEEFEELTPCGEDNNFYSSAGEKGFSALLKAL